MIKEFVRVVLTAAAINSAEPEVDPLGKVITF